jgi:radical SAM superfamily enzyme YgiQ (UPF0313 family)
MRYEGDIYRPFSEASSYLLQCTIGCSHNSCTFCGMYKKKKYRVRPLNDIFVDIEMAAQAEPGIEKVFLCDGDALAIPTADLIEILTRLKKIFPMLRHVGTYAGPRSALDKSEAELSELCSAGLRKAYLGVESGDDRVLAAIRKGVTSDEMLEAGSRLVRAGMNLSSMVLIGIAGTGQPAVRHALETARITNEMSPRYLAAMTVTPVPGTVLYAKLASGEFRLPDPFETLDEMKILIENLNCDGLKFVGTHVSNYLPVTGTLPRDRNKMLDIIAAVLSDRDPAKLRPDSFRGI